MNNLIIENITGFLFPFFQVYGFYVLLHGHSSPGGGFAGGAILGASIIFYIIVFGIKEDKEEKLSFLLILMGIFGVFIYILLGFIGVFLGSNFLSNGSLSLELGMILEPGIGLVVISVLSMLFYQLKRGG